MAHIALVATAAFALAGVGVALQAMPVVEIPVVTQVEEAEAHTGDVHADTQCINGGQQKQTTFTLTVGNVPSGATIAKVETHTGPVSFPNGWNRGTFPDNEWVTRYTNLPTLTVPPWTTPAFPGSTTGNGPWELVVTTFSNGVVVLSDTRAENMTACTREVTPSLSFTPGDCINKGKADAIDTAEYTWTRSGPDSAAIFTAHPVGNVTLTKTVFGPYDLTRTDYKNPACKPSFTIEKSCAYIKITYNNPSQWPRYPDYHYTGDGVVGVDYGPGLTYTNVKVNPGETKVIFEKTFAEDYNGGAPIDVQYQDILGAERDIDTAAVVVQVDTNCQPDVIPATPVAIVDGGCVVGGGSQGTTTMSNPFPGLPNTVGTDAVFIEKIDGVDQPSVTIAPNGPTVNHSYPFGEDTGDHLVQVYDDKGNLLGAKNVGSDCAPNKVPNNPKDGFQQFCGGYSAEFSNDVGVLDPNEFADDAHFEYTDENGKQQTTTVAPNGTHVKVTVKFDEDSGSHIVKVGEVGKTKEYEIKTNCLPPGLATTGQELILLWLGLTAIYLGVCTVLVLNARRRIAAGTAPVEAA